MEKFDLIIPSAKLISENMQNLGKLPSALYPIESKTVLQRLYNQYCDDAQSIYLVAHDGIEKFKNYLNREKSIGGGYYYSNYLLLEI